MFVTCDWKPYAPGRLQEHLLLSVRDLCAACYAQNVFTVITSPSSMCMGILTECACIERFGA